MTRRASLWITAGAFGLLLASTPLLRPLWRERTLRAAPRPLDVILITLDTTRADRLGCYGHGGGTSPHLDGLARSGVLFRRAYSHVPLTGPSHSSLLTGLLPSRHGVHDNGGYVLKEEFATLAEQFVEAGYRTGAFVSAFVLDRRFGLARGFSTYEDDVLQGRPEDSLAAVRSEVTVDRALAWLRAADRRPAFAWVHLYDPHLPYDPPEPYASRFKDSAYDGEIAYMDAQVGRLLDGVASRGRPALVAAIGDHGESLGEHQELTHSYFIYQGTQRVPFLLSLPGWLPQGHVEPVVRAVDLVPTLLEIAGLPVPPGLDGESLVPLITRRSGKEPGPAYLESYHPRLWWGARELLGLRTGQWLFIQSPRPELYNVDEDPGETVNLAARHPQEMERFAARLKGYAQGSDPMAGLNATDPETAGRLRALGYAGGIAAASGPADGEELPDAKDNAPLLAAWSQGEDLLAKGQLEAALGKYREALAANPRSVTVRLIVANTLLSLGRFHESCEAFAGLAVQYPKEPAYVQGMARCLAGDGRKKDALDLLAAAVAKAPGSTPLRESLGLALLDAGRAADAERELRRVVDESPRRVGPLLALASALVKLDRARDATSAFVSVVQLSPRSPEGQKAARALEPLAGRLLEQGDLMEARKAYRAALDAGAGGASGEAVYLNLALVAYRLGRRDESVEVLQMGLARLPESANLHYRLGRLRAEEGRRADAERAYRRAIELDGARNDARLALASLLGAPEGRP